MKPPIAAPWPEPKAPPYLLIIAGSDPSGGAGMQSDIKTALENGCESGAVAASLTVQTGRGVRAHYPVAPHLINEQLAAIYDDIAPSAIKIGMIGSAENAYAVAPWLEKWRARGVPVVLDPVCVSSSGFALIDDAGKAALTKAIFPLSTIVTPNLAELLALSGAGELEEGARALVDRYGVGVLVTGGDNGGARATDYYFSGTGCASFSFARTPGGEGVRGTGCMFSCALAAGLAKGREAEQAIFDAKRYAAASIALAHSCGAGRPVAGRALLAGH